MSFQAVLKVGGSLGRAGALPALCQEITRLGAAYPLLVVPGGGEFADQVRSVYHRFRLGDTAAHSMAVLAMDQYGYLLSELIPHSAPVASLRRAQRLAATGRIPVLLPAALVRKVDPLPHSWEVTSDTIAAWIACQSASSRLILLKDVDGLYSSWRSPAAAGELLLECSPAELDPHLGGVDESLARFLASAQLETWVINGSHPARLSQLLATGHTLGTCIRPPTPFPGEAV
ncbi:MAG TPA: hypothetical protein VN363_00235 [Anaerolineales bacterium]|nr:hypothetical protein [Anaerolineales bacterium]